MLPITPLLAAICCLVFLAVVIVCFLTGKWRKLGSIELLVSIGVLMLILSILGPPGMGTVWIVDISASATLAMIVMCVVGMVLGKKLPSSGW